jgi:hypothetical protein
MQMKCRVARTIGEAVVRVGRGFDGVLLRRVVATLGGMSC